jgi:hypothetical protein
MSPTKRASGVPGLRAAIQAAPHVPPASESASSEPSAAGRPDVPPPAAPRSRPRPPKPVRYTLDLSPDDHRFLKRFALDAEVNASTIVRALIGQLRTDSDLAERVRSDAWSQ